jgi:hypothetical protein
MLYPCVGKTAVEEQGKQDRERQRETERDRERESGEAGEEEICHEEQSRALIYCSTEW